MSKSKPRTPRLGRGLSSLLTQSVSVSPVAESEPAADGEKGGESTPEKTTPREPGAEASSPPADPDKPQLVYLSIDAIRPNPNQPRQQFNQAALDELAASIKSEGLMQPVVVRQRSADPPAYELVAGERRWRAARKAGLAQLPAIVRDLNDTQTAEWALIENIQREDLNPMERALGFDRLRKVHDLSHEKIAERVGVNRSTVTNSLRLLGLCETVRDMIREALISEGHAKALAALPDSQQQILLAKRIVQQDWSVRQTEKAARNLSSSAPASSDSSSASPTRRSAHFADLEQQIGRQLGTKVALKAARKKGAGSVTIHFYDLDQFDQLLQRLGIDPE